MRVGTRIAALAAVLALAAPAGAVAAEKAPRQSFYSGEGIDNLGKTQQLSLVVNPQKGGKLHVKILSLTNTCSSLVEPAGSFAPLKNGTFSIDFGSSSNSVSEVGTLSGTFSNKRTAVVQSHSAAYINSLLQGVPPPGTPSCESTATITVHKVKPPKRFRR